MRALLLGAGQLGRTLGGGLLACGVSVDVALRGDTIETWSQYDFILVAVGEKDLKSAIEAIPIEARNRLVLLQNDLVPETWRALHITQPTVLVVWFEKKKGKALQVVRTSDLSGPQSALFTRVFEAIDAPTRIVSEREIVASLVVKNLYINGSNAMGLKLGGGTTGSLVTEHRASATSLLRELFLIERSRLSAEEQSLVDEDALLEETFAAFASEPQHGLLGRTAQERVARAQTRARESNLATPLLDQLAARVA